MWAAINHDNRECTLFAEERDALLYVALQIVGYSGPWGSHHFPMNPRKMDTAALAAAVNKHGGDDKAWFVTETEMGEPQPAAGDSEDEQDE